jgi:hypothetical protein
VSSNSVEKIVFRFLYLLCVVLVAPSEPSDHWFRGFLLVACVFVCVSNFVYDLEASTLTQSQRWFCAKKTVVL